MLIRAHPPVHLTYCLNVHPGESWPRTMENIRTGAARVKAGVAPDVEFGLGLRLADRAARELLQPPALARLKSYLREHGMYVFTINGFPYGRFHGARVKERVYAPDWTTRRRLNYTMRLADLLAALLPDGVDGSISTVPGSFKAWIKEDGQRRRMAHLLVQAAAHLARVHAQTGKLIHLGLEPEPACFIEKTSEFLYFFHAFLRPAAEEAGLDQAVLRRHLGVCLDTCHAAVQGEVLERVLRAYEADGIRISKVQISAALQSAAGPAARRRLAAFRDRVYLHQVRGLHRRHVVASWTDLPDYLAKPQSGQPYEHVRVHFHVPLFWPGDEDLSTTATELTPDFFRHLLRAKVGHWEVETYTYEVMPPALRPPDVASGVVRELAWVRSRMP